MTTEGEPDPNFSSDYSKNGALVIAVGSENRAKLKSVELSCLRLQHETQTCQFFKQFSSIQVLGCSVSSGVRDQPLSDEEAIEGATNRALAALEKFPDAHFGIGLEGGVHLISNTWFECGWIVVTDRFGRRGIGSSGRFEMSSKIMERILKDGQELAEIIDDLSGETDVRSNKGAMGILTDGILNRDEAYTHGIFFAFSPFLSDRQKYWD